MVDYLFVGGFGGAGIVNDYGNAKGFFVMRLFVCEFVVVQVVVVVGGVDDDGVFG